MDADTALHKAADSQPFVPPVEEDTVEGAIIRKPPTTPKALPKEEEDEPSPTVRMAPPPQPDQSPQPTLRSPQPDTSQQEEPSTQQAPPPKKAPEASKAPAPPHTPKAPQAANKPKPHKGPKKPTQSSSPSRLRLSGSPGPSKQPGALDPLPALEAYPYLPILRLTSLKKDDNETDLLVQKVIGQGGAGLVTLASQRSLFRQVALKSVRRDTRLTGLEKMLLHEGMITGHLEHPNIIPVHTLGMLKEQEPILVMKYVEGMPWSVLLEEEDHPFWDQLTLWSKDPLIRNLEILIEICKAVIFAHSKGIIHRDIKPSNVMLSAHGGVYLLDWGLAYLFDKQSPLAPIVHSGLLLDETEGFYGTPTYMAPEMLDEVTDLDPQTDIFLLGGVLYTILHGHAPHQGENVEKVLLSIFQQPEKPFRKGCPPELIEICKPALSFYKEDRYEDVVAFRAELIAYLQHRNSLETCEDAEAKLADLRRQLHQAGGEREGAGREHPIHKMYQLFYSCRFGFEQALREWPQNQRARRGLERSITLMFQRECAQGHLDLASSLLNELPSPPPQLVGQLAEKRAEQKAAEEEKKKLQAMQHELDFSVARSQRIRLMLLMGSLATAFALIRFILGAPSDVASGHFRALSFAALTTALLGLGVFIDRRAFFRNDVNKKFVYLLFFVCSIVTVHRVLRALQQFPLHSTYISDLVLISCVMGTAAISFRLWLGWVGLLQISAAGLCVLWPSNAYNITTVSIAAGWILCGLFWDQDNRSAVDLPKESLKSP